MHTNFNRRSTSQEPVELYHCPGIQLDMLLPSTKSSYISTMLLITQFSFAWFVMLHTSKFYFYINIYKFISIQYNKNMNIIIVALAP